MSNKMGLSTYEASFKSVLAPYIIQYLRLKEASGTKIDNHVYNLLSLDRIAVAEKAKNPVMTEDLYMAWRKDFGAVRPATEYEKISIIGQFCRYLVRLGAGNYVPSYPKKPAKEYVPYIFTKEELHKIFTSADSLLLSNRDMTTLLFSIPALLRLLYSTGIRIGEACSLTNGDVDLKRCLLTIRNTKNKRERILPICDSLKDVLLQYQCKRAKLPLANVDKPDSPYFISLKGKAVSSTSTLRWFHKILKKSGINYIPHNGPRIHDLRHTFAVHALDAMGRNGKDIYCGLPILSVALGHKCVSDTELYVRITNQVYPDLSEMSSKIAEYIFPTIKSI